ncbi:DUF1697 domain-containing protein [Salinimicrobium sp. GXAS 041]|uniref:DUF1697 domain-containing protein n=1 Tax=Salinimicrobium sp. GXAS 041 TaxID=3400806 RepID=UPI003C73DAF7
MTKYVAILRGINVGGKRKILMKDLKLLFEKLGFNEVQTYIQSGNVIFCGNEIISEVTISEEIEQAILEKFGFEVPVIIRTSDEFEKIYSENPFLPETDISRLHVTFLGDVPEDENEEKLKNLDFSPDSFRLIGKNIFIDCAGKYHKTKLSNQFFESKLKVKATTRNWKTVLKLLEMTKV